MPQRAKASSLTPSSPFRTWVPRSREDVHGWLKVADAVSHGTGQLDNGGLGGGDILEVAHDGRMRRGPPLRQS